MRTMNRWVIATAGVFLQIALGAVYAWSIFRILLAKQFGWSIPEVTLTFTISIFVLGISAFFGGLWSNRRGPRIVALAVGVLYGLGVFLASFSDRGLWWLYLRYGVIGGPRVGARRQLKLPNRLSVTIRSGKRLRPGSGGRCGFFFFSPLRLAFP